MAFWVVATLVLLAALIVAPAAARDVAGGSTIFVGEENLNLTAINGTPVATLVHYGVITPGFTGRTTISVDNSGAFELTAADVGASTGTWYAFPAGAGLDNPGAANGIVFVQVPSAQLNVKIAGTTGSVNGQSVTQANRIQFEILHNLGSLTPVAAMDIEVTTPGGSKVNVFGNNGVDLRGIVLTGNGRGSPAIELAGVEIGTYTARAAWPGTSDFYGKGYDSNTVTFEVTANKVLTMTANKGSVVGGNNFVVTITGEPDTTYYLYVKDAGLPAVDYPWIRPGQFDITLTTLPGGNPVQANVTTTASGGRSIQFCTNQSTDNQAFTIRVEDPADSTLYDEVRVFVEQGDVTITASGTGVYYIGEEITLSGTNTDSDTTYLFLTGPNLPTSGVKLSDPGVSVVNGSAETFTAQAVETDDTWSYRWDTSSLNRTLDASGYTIYAVSQPRSKGVLSGVPYATTSIVLRSPVITATASGAAVAKGDNLTISGYATGNPGSVYVWIFGRNYDVFQQPVTVESRGTFEYTIGSGETENMSSGQYFVVVQHPVSNGAGISVNASGYIEGQGIAPLNLEALPPPEAADALMNALASPYVDDIYANLTFSVGEPWILIDPIDDKVVGSTFTISGTTNLAASTVLSVEVTPVAFDPINNSAGAAGFETIRKGDGANIWSMSINATYFKPGQYIVRVESIETRVVLTSLFGVIEGHVPPLYDQNLTLSPGWNFISVPRPLSSGNDTAMIFAGVDTDGRAVFRYDTANRTWTALAPADRLPPL
ncbi:MEMAR_RS02690 family S-layer glycoprotein [Methanoculleus sp.]|uniref:MEMAR_RS02690 family S-layer glycoprotein n=1 Tax=Methanoculleus sp. TaxID=90427 RepID=UPI00320E801C